MNPVTFIVFRKFTLAQLLTAHDPFGCHGCFSAADSLIRHAVVSRDAIRIESTEGVL